METDYGKRLQTLRAACRHLIERKRASYTPRKLPGRQTLLAIDRVFGTPLYAKTAASRWKLELAKRGISALYDLLAKNKKVSPGLPTEVSVLSSAATNPVATKNMLMEAARGQTSSAADTWGAARERWFNRTVPKLKPIGKPISPLSLPDDASQNLWHGVVPKTHLGELLDSSGRFAERDADGVPIKKTHVLGALRDKVLYWGAAPEIGAGFGKRMLKSEPLGYVIQQRTNALNSIRRPKHPMSESITAHAKDDLSLLHKPSETPKQYQFEAVSDNAPTLPRAIYQVLEQRRPLGEPVNLHPQSRQRRINPDAFKADVGQQMADQYRIESDAMLQKMKMTETVEAIKRRYKQYLKSLGNLEVNGQ